MLYNKRDAQSFPDPQEGPAKHQRKIMRALLFTAFFVSVPLICPAGPTSQQQEQKPSQSDQEQKKAAQQQPATPVSISPVIPVGPGSPGAAAMAAGAVGGKPVAGAPVNPRTYIIGAEDIIAISVFENRDFSVPSQAVRPDGTITMPLVGEIEAWQRTPEELANEIQKQLIDKYMKEPPHVQVIIVEVKSKNYYLQGEVNKPGKYTLVVPTTVMQALVNAGGFRDFANKKDIRIQRGAHFIKFNYVEVSKGKHLEQDILLQPDDQIYVH
jgi:polysaccharide export outer membrane protein